MRAIGPLLTWAALACSEAPLTEPAFTEAGQSKMGQSKTAQSGQRQGCGIALGLFASDPQWDYTPLVEEIAAHGATDLLVVVPWRQADVFADQPMARPADLASAVKTISMAHQAGLAVSVMPVIEVAQRAPGQWRGRLQPRDLRIWQTRYRALVLDLATHTARAGAQRFVLGSELASLEGDADWWRQLAQDTRQVFPGRLTYSANWDRFEAVPFWDALDEIGVSAWFELASADERLDDDALLAAWATPIRRLRAIERQVGKPVLLTEVGYPARASAAARPWDHSGAAPPALALQQRLFKIFFQRFQGERLAGLFVWNWFGRGGTLDAGYSPRGRPASSTIKRHFARWCGASS